MSRSDAAMALSVVPDRELVAGGLSTLKEAQTYLGIGSSKLYDLMKTGDLPWTSVAGRRRIPTRALHAYAAAGLVRRDRVAS